ncbi:nuclear transport factor 2 family protein [Erythrobacter sp. SCSIO 43205]|uniref:nuclear transport factor 2 family protein n=1 Tax=Erythrobacter sp. SCSIO 43205 TaxID=2779361 RepID=UPI001CA8C8D0|nr:nuclear transport factor 2 family protein [Erythrobacter sp. SCSIO 43205]UAB79538.1 nuclear transport factor 2 family protein [Erythrobacter sp. SCSIO 43205]
MRLNFAFVGAGACLLAFATPSVAEEHTPASIADSNARIAAVQAHIDAYRSGDLDRFVATFAPDAEVYANGMSAVGHAQIKALYALNFKPGAPDLRIYDNGVDGDVVWMSAGYVYANGEEMCCSLSEYKVRGGKISFLSSNTQ